MANEPNRAEEELKRYAAERRAQAPTELHGATRRMLQGEVARVYRRREGGEVWWKRVLLAPRFAWAVSFVAIFGISILALRQPSRPREEIGGTKEQEKFLELTQSRQGVETQRDEKKEADSSATLADSTAVAPAMAPVAAPTVAVPEPAGESRLRKANASTPVKAEALPAPKPLGGAVAVARNEMYFMNNAPVSKDKTEAAKNVAVLNRFTMQDAGRNVVVVDWDGSQYSGSNLIQRAGTNTFLVSGTNRTLNQRVDFRGWIFRAPLQQQTVTLQPAQNQNVLNQNVQNQIAQEQMRVQGEAVVDNRSQVKVDAQAPAPAQ